MILQSVTLLALAVLPGLFLANFVFQSDKVDAEPAGLLWSLVLLGALSALPASILEGVLKPLVGSFVRPNTPAYFALMSFLVVAVSEEGCKFAMLRLRTWNHPAFDFRFDGIVYGVMVGVGFATLENILYVLSNGYATGVARALLSVPGHVAWGVFMGYYYGRAKAFSIVGNQDMSRRNLWLSVFLPIVWHGIYDTCAFISGPLLFVLIVVALVGDVMMIYLVRRESKNDAAFWRPIARGGFGAYATGQVPVPQGYAPQGFVPQGASAPAYRGAAPVAQGVPQSARPVAQGGVAAPQAPAEAQVPARAQFPAQPQAPAQVPAQGRPAPAYYQVPPSVGARAPQAAYVRYDPARQTKPFSWPRYLATRILGYLAVAAGLFAVTIIIALGMGENNVVYEFLIYLMVLMLIGGGPYVVIVLFAGAMRARRALRPS